jgi:hypothetical protein
LSKLGELIEIPRKCEVGNTIFKKLFFENAKMNRTDKETFTKDIEKIKWDYNLKKDNINIKPYKDGIWDFPEVEFVTVKLKNSDKTNRIAEIIMRTIPYPMVLCFEKSNEICIFTGDYKINLADTSKNRIDEFFFTDWIDLDNLDEDDIALFDNLKLKNLNFTNFNAFYNCFIENIIRYNVFKTSHIRSNLDLWDIKDIYDKIIEIDTEIEVIKGQIKKETQFKYNVERNIKIKKLKDERENLRGMLI